MEIYHHRHNFDPGCRLLSNELVNYFSSKASNYPRIVGTVIIRLCPNGTSQKIDIFQNWMVSFVCKNVTHGFSNTSNVNIRYIWTTKTL